SLLRPGRLGSELVAQFHRPLALDASGRHLPGRPKPPLRLVELRGDEQLLLLAGRRSANTRPIDSDLADGIQRGHVLSIGSLAELLQSTQLLAWLCLEPLQPLPLLVVVGISQLVDGSTETSRLAAGLGAVGGGATPSDVAQQSQP